MEDLVLRGICDELKGIHEELGKIRERMNDKRVIFVKGPSEMERIKQLLNTLNDNAPVIVSDEESDQIRR